MCGFLQVREFLSAKTLPQRLAIIQDWHKSGGVLIMGYQLFQKLVNNKAINAESQQLIASCLLDPGMKFFRLYFGYFLQIFSV